MNRRTFLKRTAILTPLAVAGFYTNLPKVDLKPTVWTMVNNPNLAVTTSPKYKNIYKYNFTYDVTVRIKDSDLMYKRFIILEHAHALIAHAIKDHDIFQRKWGNQYYARILGSSFKQMYKEGTLSSFMVKQHMIYIESLYNPKQDITDYIEYTNMKYDEYGRGHSYYHLVKSFMESNGV
jgi:hypothetical protein